MGTKEEIEKFLKDNFKEIISELSLDGEVDLTYNQIIELIQKALDHFKDKRVISDEEIEKESILTENTGWSKENQLVFTSGAKWMRSKYEKSKKDNWIKEEEVFVKCKNCNGDGYTSEHEEGFGSHDEDGSCNGNCPVKVQCVICKSTGYIPK